MANETIIIGGGFAGLAAGVALASAGRRVRLLEQKPYLGGRARSFHHAGPDATVDNGQHILMGCYHATVKFLTAIGTASLIRFQPHLSVHFVDPNEGETSLCCPPLPAPWHLFAGVLKSNSFSLGEKAQILRLGRQLQSKSPETGGAAGLTADAWMAKMGQCEHLRRNFWDLICIAALNEDSRIAAASVFEPVLRLALFQSAAGSRIGLATRGLSEVYTEAAASFIRARGGAVELGRNVVELILSHNGNLAARPARPALSCAGVRLQDGSVIEAEAVISAAPCFELKRLLAESFLCEHPFFSSLSLFQPSPIISLNLWFDREITRLEFAGLRGTAIQWLFNRGKILRSGQPHISLVISGAHDYIQREKDDLLALALGELRTLFPASRDAKLLHSLVIKERFATFSPSVEAASRRPAAVTPAAGLYLAGDWTDTGLPATIESAVKSGYTAAAEVIRGAAR